MNLAQMQRLKGLQLRAPAVPASPTWWTRHGGPCRHTVSRRHFLRAAGATGVVLGGGAVWPALAGGTCEPVPIPHVIDLPDPLPDIHILLPGIPGFHPIDADPSVIGDFNGFVGYAVVDGTGVRTDLVTDMETVNSFEVDLRFMDGEFVGADGKHCHGTFALI